MKLTDTYGISGLASRRTAFLSYLVFSVMWQLVLPSSRSAEAVDSWVEYPRPSGAGALTSVTFGNGVFVAVGANGTILTSEDGADWTKVNAGVTGESARVRFVNDRFFVWGFGTVLSSTNGSNWTPVNADFSDITFANGTYYAVQYTQLGRSTNLVDWEYQGVPTGKYRNIAYGNGAFAANGGGGTPYEYAYSSDAQNWFTAGLTSMSHLSEITHQNGTFSTISLVSYMEPRALPSPPGSPPQYTYFPVQGYVVAVSEDGAGWGAAFRLNGNISAIPNKVAAGGHYWVLPAGNSIFYSTNLVTSDPHTATNWTRVNVTVDTSENSSADIAFGKDVFVAIMHGKIVKSNPVNGAAPVRIIRHPESFAATLGGTASFTVTAQGSDPMTYQWRHAGTNLAGATGFKLYLTNLTMDAAGEYDVVVTNPAGSVTSERADLTVHFAEVKLYAGVTLRGQVGDKFKLEYRNQLEEPETWTEITNVTLVTSESIWIDYSTSQGTNRFYRASYLGK